MKKTVSVTVDKILTNALFLLLKNNEGILVEIDITKYIVWKDYDMIKCNLVEENDPEYKFEKGQLIWMNKGTVN